MIFYIIFCITTASIVLFKYQMPPLLKVREHIPWPYFFWPSVVIIDLILAPVHFLEIMLNGPGVEERIKIVIEDLVNR